MTSRRDFMRASGAAFLACLTRFAPASMVPPDIDETSESSWSCQVHGWDRPSDEEVENCRFCMSFLHGEPYVEFTDGTNSVIVTEKAMDEFLNAPIIYFPRIDR